jgi:hypothetical protein
MQTKLLKSGLKKKSSRDCSAFSVGRVAFIERRLSLLILFFIFEARTSIVEELFSGKASKREITVTDRQTGGHYILFFRKT